MPKHGTSSAAERKRKTTGQKHLVFSIPWNFAKEPKNGIAKILKFNDSHKLIYNPL